MSEFQQDETPLKVRGLSIKFRILIAAVLPMIVLAATLIIYSTISLQSSLREEAEEGLKYSVNAMAAAYDAISAKDYMLQEKGGVYTLYKGGFNVSTNQTFIDSFTGTTDLEVTVFYGDTRYATSILDENGERFVNTQAAPEVVDAVINRGEDFVTHSLDINGTNYYAYYIPIKDSSGTNVGMYFAGKPSANVESMINTKLMAMIIIGVALLLVAAAVSFFAALSISRVISNVQGLVSDVARGDLDVQIPEKFQRRKDELGLMAKALQRLVDALHRVISDIVHSADEVEQDAEKMTEMIQNTTDNATEVTNAVDNISQGAVSQAEDIERATGNVNDMGRAISEIVDKVANLTQTSKEIDRAREDAEKIINELSESSDRTMEAVDVIGKQVKLTDDSVSKISDAIVMITNIAEETNLLSLNASIEAARAGEAGKGFAVVASEIQKLAEESGKSAETISRIIDNLSKESKNTVSAMNSVQDIIAVQLEKLTETRDKFNGVGVGIADSLVEIEEIGRDSQACDEARKHVTDIIQNLSAVSEENASETEETMASMEELSSTMHSLNERADDLRRLSEELDSEVHYFSFEHNKDN
ncbi:MAG: methyl-accepting chemotaxis protein [Eubacterium sp.]|nr:methyl-accepting chemotaxis protein [Eubacterium sp.]